MIPEGHAPGCMLVLDHVATLRHVSGPCEAVFGRPVDTVLGQPFTRFLARGDVRRFLRFLWTCRDARELVPGEFRLTSGTEVLLLCVSRPVDRGFDGVMVPLGPGLKSLLGQGEAQVQAALALEDLPLALLVNEPRQGVTRMNRTARRLFGFVDVRTTGSIARLLPAVSWTGELPEHWTATRAVNREGLAFMVEFSCQQVRGQQWVWVRDLSDVHRARSVFLDVSEEERRRLGRELHDSLGQQLTGLTMLAGTLAEAAALENPTVAALADRVATLARDVVRRTRHLARGMFPPDLEDRNLGAALEDLATSLQEVHGVMCSVHLEPRTIRLREARDVTHLFRIAQEAISNSIRHGHARRVDVHLQVVGDDFRLEIRDGGQGFSPGPRPRGTGLRSMRHRAEALGAALEIAETPGGGVTVSCWRGPRATEATRTAGR